MICSKGPRWDADLIDNMQGTPQQTDPSKPGAGMSISVRMHEPAHMDEVIPNQSAGQQPSLKSHAQHTVDVRVNMGLARNAKDVGLSKQVSKARETTLNHA